MSQQITVGEAINLINDSILSFEDGLSQDTIDTIVYAINNNIQIRDYMLGIPDTYSLETCVSFIKYLGSYVEEKNIHAIATIASAYEYESGNFPAVAILLNKVLELKPDYSLALLLDRVANAGWEPSSFVKMRKELHPQVIAHLEEEQDFLIEA